jgi:membrane peptidoglycan carboxypeptidase
MHTTIEPPEQNPQPVPSHHAPKKRRSKGTWLVTALVAVLTIATVFALLTNPQQEAPETLSGRSLTLYYRDGKKVLWSTDQQDWQTSAAPGFAGQALGQLREVFGSLRLKHGDWHVTTTLDASLQAAAEAQISAQRTQLSRQGVEGAAMIAKDVTTGQVVVWANGFEGSATSEPDKVSELVPVGTLMLPFTYAALIEQTTNNGAGTVLEDVQKALPGYPCPDPNRPTAAGSGCLQNFDRDFLGRLTLRQALGTLRLVPTVQAGVQVNGTAESIKTQSFVSSLTDSNDNFNCYIGDDLSDEKDQTQCFQASTIGEGLFAAPQHILQAYATLSNNGKKLPQTSLLKAAVNGKTMYEWKARPEQAMRADTAYIINNILSDPNASYLTTQEDLFTVNGSGVGLMVGLDAGGTMGAAVQFSPKYAVGFWALSSRGISGFTQTFTLPITGGWMKAAHASSAPSQWVKPKGVKTLPSTVITINPRTGKVTSPATDLYPGWYQ